MHPHLRASILVLALLTPLTIANAHAQTPRAVPRNSSPAYDEGYDRGARAGTDDGQRNRGYDYRNKSDYRGGDAGYRREYGDRERYRIDFRLGFEIGYRDGYDRYRGGSYGRDYGWRPGDGQPTWANGRGRGGYVDQAYATGNNDGYDAGLRDGRDRHRFDPVGEGRYRDGDHGYYRNYGPRDVDRLRYREAFRQGYERGYQDGRRYDTRYNNGRPWWWPW